MFDSIQAPRNSQETLSNSSARFAVELNRNCGQNADHKLPPDLKQPERTMKAADEISGKSHSQDSSHEKPKHPKGLELPSPYPSGKDNQDSSKNLPNIDLPTKMVGPDPRTMREIAEKLKTIFFGTLEHNSPKAPAPRSTSTLLDKTAFKKALKSAEIAITQGVHAALAEKEDSLGK